MREGTFLNGTSLVGENCKLIIYKSADLKDKTAELIGNFNEKEQLTKGVVYDYLPNGEKIKFTEDFNNGIHIKGSRYDYSPSGEIRIMRQGTFQSVSISNSIESDGEDCMSVVKSSDSSKEEIGRFKEGKLIFGTKTIKARNGQEIMREKGPFDPVTQKLHGKECTISSKWWTLEGEANQGRIEKGRLTIKTPSLQLDKDDKEILKAIGFSAFLSSTPSSSWWW